MDQEGPRTPVLFYSFPIMGACLVGSILLLGSDRRLAGIAMFVMSVFAVCYGAAVAVNWRGGADEIVSRLRANPGSPLRGMSNWLMRIVGIGVVVMAVILIAGAVRIIR